MGRLLPISAHKSAIRTFENVAETHDPISMRSQVQCQAGGISRDQTRPFAYNKRRVQKPYPFLLSYLEDGGAPSRSGTGREGTGRATVQNTLDDVADIHVPIASKPFA